MEMCALAIYILPAVSSVPRILNFGLVFLHHFSGITPVVVVVDFVDVVAVVVLVF